MSKADELRKRQEALRAKAAEASRGKPATVPADEAARTSAAPAAAPVATPSSRSSSRSSSSSAPAAPKVKPIRSTVDLPPRRHNELKMWLAETAVELGTSRITTQDVVRTLIERLMTDETLARKIRADLRTQLAQ